MITTNMKSSIIKLRFSVLLVLFLILCHGVSAYVLNPYLTPHSSSAVTITASPGIKPAAPVIDLSVSENPPGVAQLSWTLTTPVSDGNFFVERQVAPSPTWDLLAQVPYSAPFQYADTISYPYCTNTNFTYRIRYESVVPANSAISDSEDIILKDVTNPANVENVIVSIAAPWYPIVSWKQVSDDEIFGYEIDRFNGLSWPPHTTLPSDSSSYLDLTVTDGCGKSYSYVIVTIDMCKNRSAPSYSPAVQTIKLDLPPIDECERLAKLTWNPYYLMPGGLGGYRIFRMVDYGAPVEIANLTGADTLNTSYNDAFQFENGSNYTYYVQAYSATGIGSSSSCKIGSTFTGANVADSVYITRVGVISNSYISLDYHSTPENTIKKLVLERSNDGITFFPIDSLVAPAGFVASDSVFSDNTADIQSQSYYYRLVAFDNCGTNKLFSNISRTVHLNCSSSQTQNTIDWNSYESWLKGVEGYKIYRTVDAQPLAGELIGSVTPATLSFPDLLAGVDPTKQVCYWVSAAENPGNPYLTNATSLSNTCCIIKGATLFMPTAFHPGGINDRFRPVATFVEPQSFRMIIFSRWGQQIFETTDMVNGWDGLLDGNIAPPGLYAYYITYTSLGGQDYTKRGTVFLVR